jgi:hypothetical protein
MMPRRKNKIPKPETWPPEHVQFLKDNYLKIPLKRISKILGLNSDTPVFIRMKRYGLKISAELREQRKYESQFHKGHIPVNKGLKQTDYMDAETIARTAKTRFQKGHLPHNTKYDGCIRTRIDHKKRGGKPYQWIRLSPGKWQMLHVYTWEKANGKVPAGYMVRFRNGNALDCRLDNLELVTHSEHLEKNTDYRTSDGYIAARIAPRDAELRKAIRKMPEVLELQRIKSKLNKEIKNVAKKQAAANGR